MSEINNLSDIRDNFETIKSLLNSIRAQEVLNTGDLNKLLATMNGKLDRINQEENMELMNAVLASIKQSLDERHSVWVSKFSTIESLFSNILKNSVDSLKSSEIKELFDIIATNLSVFSREVVSQKDTLTDIVGRIEQLRSEDPSSITIISNLDGLRRDMERFNNGFESIIVNLNDNFNSIVRTLAEIREKSADNHYDKDFENLYMTSNSLLSIIQTLDNKSVKIEETLASILSKCDNKSTNDKISELFQQNKEIYNSIGELAVNTNVEPLYQKIDNATSLISSLKEVLQNVDADSTSDYINKLGKIESAINKVIDDNDFDKLRADIETALNQIANSVNISHNDLYVVKNNLETIANSIKALDIHVHFQNIQSTLTKSEVNIKTYISDLSNKFTQLSDLTFQRTVDDIKQKVDLLGSEIKTVAGQNLEALAGSLIGLKSSISDIEVLAGASNEKLAKSVGERLSALENTLSGLLNAQSMSIGTTGKQMTELASTVDLKLDTVSTEFSVVKHSMESLKGALEPLVEMDFQATMSGFKSEIVDFQSLLASGLQNSENENSAKILESLNVRFENLKLQSDECSRNLSAICKDGLSELRSLLNGITSTLIDIVSYVSVTSEQKNDTLELDKRFTDIEYSMKDYSLDVIEKVNAYLKENIERLNTRLTNYDATSQNHFQNLATRIENNSTYIREDIKKAFNAIEMVKTEIAEFKDYVIEDLNNNAVKAEFVDRIAGLKNYITESLNAFETTMAQSNSERFTEEQAMNARVIQKIEGIVDVNRAAFTEVKAELVNSVKELLTNSVDDVMDNVRSFVEVSTNSNSQELEKFRGACNSITQSLQKEIAGISTIIDLGDKVDVVKANVCEFVSAEFEKSQASITELIKSIPVVEDNTLEIERIVNDLLAAQEVRITDEIADRFRDFESQIISVENNTTSNSLAIMNKLSGLEAGVTRSLERNELNQTEISERLEIFGNTLYKFIGNGGITVSQAFEKLDELGVTLAEKSASNETLSQNLVEKLENLSLDISKILANEASVRVNETLAELLEKTESLGLSVSRLQTNEVGVKTNSALDELLEKVENIGLDVSTLQANETGLKTNSTLAELLRKVENIGFDVSALQANDDGAKTSEALVILLEKLESLGLDVLKLQVNETGAKTNSALVELLDKIEALSLDVSTIKANEIGLKTNDALVQLLNKVENLGVDVSTIKANEIGLKTNNALAELSEKAELLSLEVAKLQTNEIGLKTNETLAELLEKTESTAEVLSAKIQQLSKDTSHYAVAINDSLSFINMELQKPDKNAAIMDEIQSIRSFLDVQVECIENVHELCKTVADNSKQQELVSLIQDLKSDIIAQMMSVLNQISLSTKEDEIIDFIKLQQDDIRKSIVELTTAVDEISVSGNKLLEAEFEKLAFSIEQLKEGSVVSTKLDDINSAILTLGNNIKGISSEIPVESIEYLRSQIEKLTEDVKLNKTISQSLDSIKAKISEFDTAHSDFEKSFNQVITTLATISSADELKSYITSGFDGLYNKIAQRIDLSSSNSELNALITTVIAKQDANFADTLARFDKIGNSDVIDSLETLKSDIITQLLAVFNQVSFESEAAEIRSDVLDVKESLEVEIKKVADDIATLISSQKDIVEDYSTAMGRLEDAIENNHVFELKAISEVAVSNKEMAESIENNHISQLKAIAGVSGENQALATALEELKTQVKAIHNSGDVESTYSLIDIESDLAKLRLSFSDMNSNLNKKEFTTVLNSLDTVITQIQDLREFIPAEKVEVIDENTVEILDILEGFAQELKNVHTTQDDIIGEIRSDVDVAKSDIQMSLEDFASEIKEYNKDTITSRLATVKSEIITQILAIINQVSFVEEQEEIISHIDSVQAQLNKLSSGSEDEMGDYSLFDVETDITKLRITLEEIKAQGRGAEIDNLVEALAQASDTLEYLKAEIPNHEISEIRAELEKIANDIISISIRTNKLLISSDESYKNLKENIEDFQAVMAGVDERTKNLYEEVGMDKIESQVTSIRDIVGRQELTNQVFNEVFEYLAEWIDTTGEKIGYITDKLNNSEDINEIKLSLEELRNSTSVKFELDAQSEKIDAMESKLNVIIESLEPTFQHQNERMLNLERKVNRIVDFFEPAFTKQQERINKLESMLDKILDVVSSDNGFDNALDRLDRISEIVESKNDTQLVKKLTSFEKQITKLNKTVEKLTNAN